MNTINDMDKSMKQLLGINILFGLCVVASLMAVIYIDSMWLKINVLLFLQFVTFASNMIIFAYGQRILSFAFTAQEELTEVEDEWKDIVDSLDSAGVTADKLQKFEPLVDKLSEFLDRVEEGNIEKGVDMLIDVFNSLGDDEELMVPDHGPFEDYIEGDDHT